MKKKFLTISALLIALLSATSSFVFANTNMINTIEQSAQNMTSAAGNMVTRGVDATKNAVGDVNNGVKRGENNVAGMTTNNGNNNRTGNYTATRTNANTATWLGLNATAWTWLIMGIVAVAIVALVWYYGREHSASTHTND